MPINNLCTKIFGDNFKKDFLASIVVFLVAMPLCLGIAIASGTSVGAGLISGIIGGIVVGSFSGCPLQVSGPAAGLIVIVYETIKHQGIEKLGIIVLIAGILQILMGVLKLGPWFRAVSPAILQGMLSGIGISIFFSQFHIMLDKTPKESVIANIISIPEAVSSGIFPLDGSTHHLAAAIGLLTLSIILIWKFLPKKAQIIPSALVAVIAAMIVSNLFSLPIKYIELTASLADSINLISAKSFEHINLSLWISSITIAFIASAETLLTATAVDRIATNSKTDYNKEILSQGLGNTIAGAIGVLPITGVMVRSATNVQAGAVSRRSAIMHGIWILIFVALCPFALKYIPTASLAAILVYTGYKLINIEEVKRIYVFSRGEFIIWLITSISIIATNLLEGILIGIASTLIKNIYKSFTYEINVDKDPESNQINITIRGNLTFLKLPLVAHKLEELENENTINIDLSGIHFIDHACVDFLNNWSEKYIQDGGKVTIDWRSIKNVYPNSSLKKMNIKKTHRRKS